MLSLLGQTFLDQYKKVDESSLENIDLIGLYFSAIWCGPCRIFTPQLTSFYKQVNQDRKKMEIFFVSKDRSKEEFLSYYKHMPFLAMPFDDQQRLRTLFSFYRIQGIPTLVILDNQGRYVTKEGKYYVETMGEAAYYEFMNMKNQMYSDIKTEE